MSIGHMLDLAADVAAGDVTVFDLEQERFAGAPYHPVQHPGFAYGLNRRHEPGGEHGEGGRTSAAGLVIAVEHFGTHVDAFCHQAVDGRMFGGCEVTPDVQASDGFRVHGAETIGPFVTPGVLIDVARFAPDPGDEGLYSLDDVQGAAERQGVVVSAGDVVLVRTGRGALWAAGDPAYAKAPGIAGHASAWLADIGVRAVGVDNMAWDVPGLFDPAYGTTFPGHVLLLVEAGIHIFENLWLDELATAEAWEFLYLAAPLKIRGGTGAPVRPLAFHRPSAPADPDRSRFS